MPAALKTNWGLVEKFMLVGGSFAEAASQFSIKENSIRHRARRCKWPLPAAVAKTKLAVSQRNNEALLNQALMEQHALSWEEKGEEHRRVAFDLAHKSLKKMKPQAPRNFRDAEAADKMARRAAGLENIEAVNQTLIALNNTSFDEPIPIEAELVEPPRLLSEP